MKNQFQKPLLRSQRSVTDQIFRDSLTKLEHVGRFFRRPSVGEVTISKSIGYFICHVFLIFAFCSYVSLPRFGMGFALSSAVLFLFFTRTLWRPSWVYAFSFPTGFFIRAAERKIVGLLQKISDRRISLFFRPYWADVESFAKAFGERCSLSSSDVESFAYQEIDAFRIYLRSRGRDVPLPVLAEILNELTARQLVDQIKQDFLRRQPDLTRSSPVESWAEAYVNRFGNDDRFFQTYLYLCGAKTQDARQDARTSKLHLTAIAQERSLRASEQKIRHVERILKHQGKAQRLSLEDVDHLDGHVFEKVVEKLFRDMGFVVHPTRQTGDQGGDLLLTSSGIKTVVQIKRYSEAVGNAAIQEVVAARGYYNCDQALVVTNQVFTRAAVDLARTNDVRLCDRNELAGLLYQYPQSTALIDDDLLSLKSRRGSA